MAKASGTGHSVATEALIRDPGQGPRVWSVPVEHALVISMDTDFWAFLRSRSEDNIGLVPDDLEAIPLDVQWKLKVGARLNEIYRFPTREL